MSELTGALETAHAGSPVIDAVLGLSVDESIADQLGIERVTVLAVRPDRYLGFRHDGGEARAMQTYLDALTA